MIVLYGSNGLTREALSAIREDFREFLGTALTVVILFSALTGWLMAKRALSGVVRLSRTAIAVADGDLEKRVPVKGGQDEIDRLAVTFNTMLERIQILIAGMKETNDNIAHDLRSPVTRMRGNAEATLTIEASSEDARILAGDVVNECDRLLGMIDTMLDISEAEAGVLKPHVAEVDIMSVVQDAIDLFQPLAEDKYIDIKLHAPDSLMFYSDLQKLQRILANLLDNAIKFTPQGGAINVSVDHDDEWVVVAVQDTGTGISEEDLPHIFDRFFRGETSRSEPGSGLGLSLAKAFARALGGSLTVTSIPGKGTTFTVALPR
jgi:signal transduction histidine kinase